MYGCFAGPDSPFSFFIFFSFFFFFLMFLNPRLSAIVLLVDLQFFCVLSFFLFLYLFLSFSLRAPFPSPFPPPAFKIRRVQLISKKKKNKTENAVTTIQWDSNGFLLSKCKIPLLWTFAFAVTFCVFVTKKECLFLFFFFLLLVRRRQSRFEQSDQRLLISPR